jgi:hypothetical protein
MFVVGEFETDVAEEAEETVGIRSPLAKEPK